MRKVMQNFSGLVGGNRLPGGPGGRAIQEWRPSDGVEFADVKPACRGDTANWVDGHYDCLLRAFVGGREIWGKTIPYGKVWRAGANQNTTITFADDVSVEGKPLPAGTYGLHVIPNEDHWTIIFSKNSTSWGSFSYDEKEDALRVDVKPQPAEFREALTYTFDDIKPESAAATLRWDKLAVPFHISVDVKSITERSIRNQLRNTGGFSWAGYDEAATWCLDGNCSLEQALKWEDTSIQNEERFENLLTKSQILAAMGKKQEADATQAKALEKANGAAASCVWTRPSDSEEAR